MPHTQIRTPHAGGAVGRRHERAISVVDVELAVGAERCDLDPGDQRARRWIVEFDLMIERRCVLGILREVDVESVEIEDAATHLEVHEPAGCEREEQRKVGVWRSAHPGGRHGDQPGSRRRAAASRTSSIDAVAAHSAGARSRAARTAHAAGLAGRVRPGLPPAVRPIGSIQIPVRSGIPIETGGCGMRFIIGEPDTTSCRQRE
jgi:hypothetical protein